MGILSLLLWTPAMGVLLLTALPGRRRWLLRLVANGFSAATLALSGWLLSRYDSTDPKPQFTEYLPLNPDLGSAYALAVDGLSMPMLLLTNLLVAVALWISQDIDGGGKGYTICVLLLQFGLLGVFLAQDWGLFYIFWQLLLVSAFFLIDRWGEQRRHAAGLRFALYAMGGSVFMLLSLLAIGQHGLPQGGWLMTSVSPAAQSLPLNQQTWVLLGFLAGFGINMALFPLHGWLPLAQAAAPGPVNILISGVLLKIGAYGLLRAVVMLPAAVQALQSLLLFLALAGMVYGSLLAWRQNELKAMVAYWSVAQTAVVLTGIASLNAVGINGAVLQMTAHGLIAGCLSLLVLLLYRRTATRSLQAHGSLLDAMPKFSLLLVLTLLAAMAMPGGAGFIAVIHVLIGGYQQWQGLMALFVLGLLITGAYSIRVIGLLCTGPAHPDKQTLKDLTFVESAIAGALVLGFVLLGLHPAPWLKLSAATTAHIGHSLARHGF